MSTEAGSEAAAAAATKQPTNHNSYIISRSSNSIIATAADTATTSSTSTATAATTATATIENSSSSSNSNSNSNNSKQPGSQAAREPWVSTAVRRFTRIVSTIITHDENSPGHRPNGVSDPVRVALKSNSLIIVGPKGAWLTYLRYSIAAGKAPTTRMKYQSFGGGPEALQKRSGSEFSRPRTCFCALLASKSLFK